MAEPNSPAERQMEEELFLTSLLVWTQSSGLTCPGAPQLVAQGRRTVEDLGQGWWGHLSRYSVPSRSGRG